MKIVIAPNAFKNSLPAAEVAAALKEGLLRSGLSATLACCPVGDGGDGTGELLRDYFNAQTIACTVADPLGRPISAPFGWVTETRTAIIEMADASGLRLLNPGEYAPKIATTTGCGQLLKAAFDKGAAEILLCIGGSATVDGGTGILKELGVRFNDKSGNLLQQLPVDLQGLDSIDLSGLNERINHTRITILCDVKNRLLGAKGAAAVFGPQKGATPGNMALLEKALTRLNEVAEKVTGVNMNALEYSGAAGGVAAALVAFCKARAVDGIDYFLQKIHFGQQLAGADWVITGEGTIDQQTLDGKAPYGVARMAKEQHCKVIGVAGKVPEMPGAALDQYFDRLFSINEIPVSLAEAIKNTRTNLVKVGERIGKRIGSKDL
ncbi:MAG: glycerate kinase [Niabella sp.]|nr:glycerate kinase [Niabella sp.]